MAADNGYITIRSSRTVLSTLLAFLALAALGLAGVLGVFDPERSHRLWNPLQVSRVELTRTGRDLSVVPRSCRVRGDRCSPLAIVRGTLFGGSSRGVGVRLSEDGRLALSRYSRFTPGFVTAHLFPSFAPLTRQKPARKTALATPVSRPGSSPRRWPPSRTACRTSRARRPCTAAPDAPRRRSVRSAPRR